MMTPVVRKLRPSDLSEPGITIEGTCREVVPGGLVLLWGEKDNAATQAARAGYAQMQPPQKSILDVRL